MLQEVLLMQFCFTGVNHGDELIYLFILPFLRPAPTDLETAFLDEREKLLSSRMIHVWTNFAKYGYIFKNETYRLLRHLKVEEPLNNIRIVIT